MASQPYVFISYNQTDREYALALARKLRDEGFDVWIDKQSINSGEDWWSAILKGVEGCAAFIILMSPQSDQSEWVQDEVTLAKNNRKRIFPLLLRGDFNTTNWKKLVRYELTDLRTGELPPAPFYDDLATAAPRREGRGTDVTVKSDGTLNTPSLGVDLQKHPVEVTNSTVPRQIKRRWRIAAVIGLLISMIGIGFAVIANKSAGYILGPLPTPSVMNCANAPKPRLVVGGKGQGTPGLPNNVRDLPNGRRLGQIPMGGVFDVLAAPVCAGGYYWWRVQYNDLVGWVAEGEYDGNQIDYWLEPE